jgi:callose synthase
MAFELYGMLAGNVSPMTGENVKLAYGGDEEAFLMKVVTLIYKVIENVCQLHKFRFDILSYFYFLNIFQKTN